MVPVKLRLAQKILLELNRVFLLVVALFSLVTNNGRYSAKMEIPGNNEIVAPANLNKLKTRFFRVSLPSRPKGYYEIVQIILLPRAQASESWHKHLL